jgi:twitching motility protein PilT
VDIKSLLKTTIDKGASDLHLIVGSPPVLRIDGKLVPLPELPVLDAERLEGLLWELVSDEQKELLLSNREVDFSFAFGEIARFRINAYYQKGFLTASLRLIPMTIKTLEELNLPRICQEFTKLVQGFILVTGPTGQGKSTTLAAMINEVNQERAVHILTIEDPIEYVYPQGKAVVSQRELHLDTHSWDIALRSAFRQDPDVVLIGEMRDYETISSALTIAETGHLVLATLHTNDAAQTVDRIVDVFPENQQAQVRLQLSGTLEGIISQRLVPSIEGGRVPACEILIATSAVKTVIREGKTHQIRNIIATSADLGMVTLEESLASWVRKGTVSLEAAKPFALHPSELERLVRR